MRKTLPTALAACAVLVAGCGGSEAREDIDPGDQRANALACMTEDKDLDARAVDPDSIQVGREGEGPRIRFFTNSGESEAAQFEGNAEGSEHIGRALLFTQKGSDALLKDVEECLSDL